MHTRAVQRSERRAELRPQANERLAITTVGSMPAVPVSYHASIARIVRHAAGVASPVRLIGPVRSSRLRKHRAGSGADPAGVIEDAGEIGANTAWRTFGRVDACPHAEVQVEADGGTTVARSIAVTICAGLRSVSFDRRVEGN